MSKAISERKHRNKRSYQRYGCGFGKGNYREWARWIQEGRCVFLWRTSNSRTAWAIPWEGRFWIPVVYHKATKQIITVLPPAVLDEFQETLADANGERN